MKRIWPMVCSFVCLVSFISWPAKAVPSEELIRANCQSAQYILNQIEKTDAALRINRGRVYNEILDLFYAMNARLASNKISAPKLVEITSKFEDELTNFRADYNGYDDTLNQLVDMNCQEHPTDFYNRLKNVRWRRDQLNKRVLQLDKLLADYQNEFNQNVKATINEK